MDRTTTSCDCCGDYRRGPVAWRCTGGCDYDMCSPCHAAWWGSHNGLDPTAANGYIHDNTAQRARESPAAPAVGVRARLSLPVSQVERANVEPHRHYSAQYLPAESSMMTMPGIVASRQLKPGVKPGVIAMGGARRGGVKPG